MFSENTRQFKSALAVEAHAKLVQQIRESGTEIDENDRVTGACIDGLYYQSMHIDMVAAIHMVRTKQATQADIARAVNVTSATIHQKLKRAERVQKYYDLKHYDEQTSIQVACPSEIATRALAESWINVPERPDTSIVIALEDAKVNPQNWLAVLAVHPEDGIVAVRMENISSVCLQKRISAYRTKQAAYSFDLSKKLDEALNTDQRHRLDKFYLIQALAPLGTQGRTPLP